jgi:hypothetical protein
MTRYWAKGLGRYLVSHPRSVPSVVRAGWRLRRNRWWSVPPFLPLPAKEYWDFRMHTVQGKNSESLEPRLLVEAAQWAIRQPRGQ